MMKCANAIIVIIYDEVKLYGYSRLIVHTKPDES